MKKKKGKNVYEKKITLGRDADGTPVRKSITGRTLSELADNVESAKRAWAKMSEHENDVCFSTFAWRWLKSSKAVKSLNTRLMYENVLKTHLEPNLGPLYMSEITLSDLQEIINSRADKRETCVKIKLTLRQIYAAAADEGFVAPFKVSKLVLPSKKQSDKRALFPEEKDAIFKAAFSDEQKLFVHLLYYTGLRREEALALETSDIDLAQKVVCVRRTIIFDGNTPVVKDSTKSSAGRRDVPIPAAFIDELTEYLTTCQNLLFPMPSRPNEYMSQSSYVKFWKGIVRAMLPLAPSAESLTAHIFRHNYATVLYYSDVTIKMAAKLMGHSNTQMIMQIYAHLDDAQEKTAAKLDAAFA